MIEIKLIKLIQDLIITFLRDIELKARMENIRNCKYKILKLRNKLECEEYQYKTLLKENIEW